MHFNLLKVGIRVSQHLKSSNCPNNLGWLYSTLWQSWKINKSKLSQNRAFIGAKLLYMEHGLAYLQHCFYAYDYPDTWSFDTSLRKCAARNYLSRNIAQHHEISLQLQQSKLYIYAYICTFIYKYICMFIYICTCHLVSAAFQ